jgi:DNA-binding transcriptional LysR family regulator
MICYLDISNTYGMEIRDLRALLAVIRCGSFTAAADQLGFTQSAISQQVASLEHEVGHLLVHRRPVRPTPAGERLAEHAARILLRLDVARSELSNLRDEPHGVRIAVCPLAAPKLLAVALRQVRSNDPRLRVTVRSLDPRSAVAEVASGAVDAALVDGITAPNEPLHLADAGLLSSAAMAETGVAVALATDHPLRNRASIDLEVLVDAPWIVAPAFSAGIEERPPVALGQGSRVVYEGSDLLTLLALVASGLGVALLPAPACEGVDGIAAVALRSPRLVHRTELLALRTVTPRQERVIETLRATASLE